ncbi:MAG: PA14 domain-containing protein [Pseudomonadota bacterium]
MNESPTLYRVLRDQRHWDEAVSFPDLSPRNDGALQLKTQQTTAASDPCVKTETPLTYLRSGELNTTALDAGESQVWERLWVETFIPAETSVTLQLAVTQNDTAPNAQDWQTSPSLDVLVRTLFANTSARFLWVKVILKSHTGLTTPALIQVQASTTQPSYLDHLPAIYRRDDNTGFLERWLALFRSELGDWDRQLQEQPREIDARTAAENNINSLAAWIALDLPSRMAAPEQRELLSNAYKLYQQRSTPAGLRKIVRSKLGITIHIFEAFRDRHNWRLGEGLGLGLDTGLAAATPDGIIVPGFTYANPQFAGLKGDYYQGRKFEILRHTRIDKNVNFNWGELSPLADVPAQEHFPVNEFSVRWSGQVRPRYTETYTFRTISDDGVRLRINGRLIIDNWTDHGTTNDLGQIQLEAGHWYSIELEFYENTVGANIELYWSSMSQRLEIVPTECLYSRLDRSVEFAPTNQNNNLMEIGQTIVGESRPQTADQFGVSLSDDYAHLFTVVVPAAQIANASQRQALIELIEAEKPAHTDFQLCFIEPKLQVGAQALVGINTIVAGAGPGLQLGSSQLGLASYLKNDTEITHKHDIEFEHN